MSILSSSGDIGDLVALAACIKAIPNGPHKLVVREDGRTKGITKRLPLIKDLFESQPYISSCEVWNGQDKIDWASEKFRDGFHSVSHSLVRAHELHGNSVRAVRSPVSTRSPWMTVTPSSESHGRRIIVRSPRYNNAYFPHKQIKELYGDSLLFLGLPDEHRAYEQAFGKVEYRPTSDLLEAAQLIAGSDLLISNQTAMLWIGHALAHPRIVEVSTSTCDSVVLSGFNKYVVDGEVELPHPNGNVFIKSPVAEFSTVISTVTVPPHGGWKAPDERPSQLFKALQERVCKNQNVTKEEAKMIILKETHSRHPDFFPPGERADLMRNLTTALADAEIH
jgi:hypothetical protein